MGEVLKLLLPGIGGSVLAERKGGGYVTAWDAGFVDIAELVLSPDELSLDRDLVAIGPIRSTKLIPGWTVVHGYEGLVEALAAGGTIDWGHPGREELDPDVVVVPYDWRRSVVDAAHELDRVVVRRLRGLSEAERVRRVQIVAHSMGGLVARYWLGPMGRWRWCHSLVTLGTPHRGAPKALDALVNGVRIRKRLVHRVVLPATGLLRSFPSVYELLPRYRAVSTANGAVYPKDLDVEERVPGFGERATKAFEVHREIEAAWAEIPASGPTVVPVMSWNSGTLSSATWDGERLQVTDDFPVWLDLPDWEADAGDGTVPMLSAVPIEMGAAGHSWRRGLERHGKLASARIGAEVAQDLLRSDPLAARGDHRAVAAVGLVVDEWAQSGEPVPCEANLRNVEVGDGRVWASVFADGADRGRVERVELEVDGSGRFRAEFAPLAPGRYRVRVEALNTSRGDLAPIEDVIDVVD